jgi:hypothetical protein
MRAGSRCAFCGRHRKTRSISWGEERTPFRREFDLSIEAFQEAPARNLDEADLLQVIEPGDTVMGVALILRPEEMEALPLLIAAYRDDDSLLDEQVVELLNALQDALPEQKELLEFFRTYPGERRERLRIPNDVPGEDEVEALVED